ncbi:MAG: hypothetical protein ABIN91_15220 [Mucilaginibacter sp.]|uniref:hypothetical protein n=1 Tax=Mucilaginibacter sp. TaxID=1882438 RepID=UPI003267661D
MGLTSFLSLQIGGEIGLFGLTTAIKTSNLSSSPCRTGAAANRQATALSGLYFNDNSILAIGSLCFGIFTVFKYTIITLLIRYDDGIIRPAKFFYYYMTYLVL